MVPRITAALLLVLASVTPSAAQTAPISDVLRTVSSYVEAYFSRVQSIVGTETVSVQPIARDWSNEGFPRTLVYELRLDWAPGSEAAVIRDLIKVNGRPPRPKDEPKCLDGAAITSEPLEFLLARNHERYQFSAGGTTMINGQRLIILNYRTRLAEPVKTSWEDGCGSIDPGRSQGKVWIDAASGEVHRIDSALPGRVDLVVPRNQPWNEERRDLTLERIDSSIRYRAFKFDDPAETILLPVSHDSITLIRNASSMRVRHTYSNYRRFVTGGRVVTD